MLIYGDLGGISYGAYQLASAAGSVDALRFDYDLIVGIYESNKSDEWISPRLSDDVRQGVYDRIDNEKQEALAMFMKEI